MLSQDYEIYLLKIILRMTNLPLTKTLT